MKPIHIHITAVLDPTLPPPNAPLLADLMAAILRANGIKVQETTLTLVEASTTIKRRIKTK